MSKTRFPFIALHGFLGSPSDWDGFLFPDLVAFDLSCIEWTHLWEWAEAFNAKVRQKYDRPILLGYSLGGRLALHAAIQDPSLWQAAIFISTHPGLSSPAERVQRLKSDQEWADRFLTEEWEALMQAWNGRSVFSSDRFIFQRKEADYNREQLASLLLKGSLGHQEDLRKKINQLPIPLLWMVGADDQAYVSLTQFFQPLHPISKKIIIPQAGHRLAWEYPQQFQQIINNFSDSIKT